MARVTSDATRQVVSFLFCDQVGSTALLEQLGEAANDEFRRDLFAALRRPIDVFGGLEVKSQGDGLMVAFPSGPSDAVACAIAMQQAAEGLAGRDRLVPVAIRVGVATGEVTAEDGDYFGRPVVEAARLCGAAQSGQVLATATVGALVEPDLASRATPVGGLLLKGLAEPLASVSFEWSAAGDVRGTSVATPPLLDPTGLLEYVGRTAELAALGEAWHRAAEGRSAVVTVSGPAGSGKSRLVAEAARALVHDHGGVALAGSARGDPLVDALRWWARASTPDAARTTLGPVAAAVAARIPAVALQLAEFALVHGEGDPPATTSGDPIDPVVAGLAEVASRTPLLLLIDDAEAMTTPMADDVASLIELAPGGLLLVIAYRSAADGSPLAAVLSKLDGLAHSRSFVLPPLEPDQTVEAVVGLVPDLDRSAALALHEAADGIPARVTELAAAARSGQTIDDVVASVQPFKGLVPYGPRDGGLFFGRDEDIAALLQRLSRSRLLTVTGPSGAGKSSLVLAGLVPALARGALPGSEKWPLVVVEASRDDPEAVARALESLPAEGGVLVVDQAEELLPDSSTDPRHLVVDRLLAEVGDRDRSVRAILALRADRYGDLTVHPALARVVERDHVLVGPMRPDQLIGVVNGPAQRAGLRVEAGLGELVAADAAAEPGALPLVSHALRETWRRRRGSTLTIAAYREAGGVRGAIASTADDLVRDLDADGQRLIRSLFIELAEVTHTGEPVRRRLATDTVAELLSATHEDVDAVLGRAIDARLVVSDGEHVQIAHEALLREWPRLRGWIDEDRERIGRRRAVGEQAAEWDLRGRQATDLLRGGRLELARDDLAAGTEGWTVLVQDFIDESLAARESERAAEQEQLLAQRRSNRRLRVLLGSVGVLLVGSLVAGAVAVNARSAAVDQADLARQEQVRADQQADLARTEQERADQQARAAEQAAAEAQAAARQADARRLAGQSSEFESDPQLELLTAVEAVRVARLPVTEARVLGALSRRPSVLHHLAGPVPPSEGRSTPSLALLDEGHAAMVWDGEVTTWELGADGLATVRRWSEFSEPTAVIRTAAGLAVADGAVVAILGDDGEIGDSVTLPDEVELVAGSPSGTFTAAHLASGDVALIESTGDGDVRVVRTASPVAPAPAATAGRSAVAAAVAVADDGRVALVDDATVYEWDAGGGELPPVGGSANASGLAYLGGELVQQADGVGIVPVAQLSDIEDAAATSGLSIDAPFLDAAAFPPDVVVEEAFGVAAQGLASSRSPDGGDRVAHAPWGMSIQWTDSGGEQTPQQPALDPGLGFLSGVALAPDGRSALAVGADGVALVALDGRTSLQRSSVALGDAFFTTAVPPSVSPDGSRLALLDGSGDVMMSQVVDLATGEPVGRPVRGRAGFLDDRTIVSGDPQPDGLLLQNIDAATGDATGEETLIPGFVPSDLAAEDAAGGRIIITGTFDGASTTEAVFVERGSPTQWRTLDELGAFEAVAIRPNHDEVFAIRSGQLERVDLGMRTVAPVPVAGSELERLAFSGDGATLFVSAGNRVSAIDLSAPEVAAPTLLAVLPGGVTELAADAAGERVVANIGTGLEGGPVIVDASTGEVFAVGQLNASQVAFLPNGDLLVIDSTAARVIGFDTDRLAVIACRVATRVQTPEEWVRYGPQDAPYAPACAEG